MTGGGFASLDVREARRRVHAGAEIAFLDVREAGQFGEGHALFATPCAYSRLETTVPHLVPRPDVPLLLVDADDGIAERAAARLAEMGYGDIAIVDGGMPAWAAAGFPVYKGVNVPSKLLGELAEDVWHPRMITATELARWKTERRPFRFYDARPPNEYAKMRVPGAECLPNGELAHRLPAVARDGAPIVITCAGRTRGIVGAIGLMLAGHEGPVLALENGTQGWALSGRPLERDNAAGPFPELDDRRLRQSRRSAADFMRRHDLAAVDGDDIESLLAEPGATAYLFDVRSAGEATGDPVEGAVHAWSGQLVQATDQWVAVRHARLILLDEGGMRAALAAYWLRQLGYLPYVALMSDATRKALRRLARAKPARTDFPAPALPRIDPVQARRKVAAGEAQFMDLRSSLDYRRGHVEGATWLVRPRTEHLAAELGGRALCLIADDEIAAAWTADTLRQAGFEDVRFVDGGHGALVAAGAPVAATPAEPSDAEAIDHLFFVHDRHDNNLEASRRYLEWETGLIAQMDAIERAAFRIDRPSV